MASFNPSDYSYFLYLIKILHWNLENTGGNDIHICIYIYLLCQVIYMYIVRLSSINAVS